MFHTDQQHKHQLLVTAVQSPHLVCEQYPFRDGAVRELGDGMGVLPRRPPGNGTRSRDRPIAGERGSQSGSRHYVAREA